jgi:hypothetical protein
LASSHACLTEGHASLCEALRAGLAVTALAGRTRILKDFADLLVLLGPEGGAFARARLLRERAIGVIPTRE